MCCDRNDRRLRRGDRGVTLLEVLISTALFAFVMGGVYLLYTTMLGTMNRGELAADIQQNARVGLGRMVQEIQMAGYDPSGAIPQVALDPKDAIRAASPSCFSFVAYQWSPLSGPLDRGELPDYLRSLRDDAAPTGRRVGCDRAGIRGGRGRAAAGGERGSTRVHVLRPAWADDRRVTVGFHPSVPAGAPGRRRRHCRSSTSSSCDWCGVSASRCAHGTRGRACRPNSSR